jgi:hypothetical protein
MLQGRVTKPKVEIKTIIYHQDMPSISPLFFSGVKQIKKEKG